MKPPVLGATLPTSCVFGVGARSDRARPQRPPVRTATLLWRPGIAQTRFAAYARGKQLFDCRMDPGSVLPSLLRNRRQVARHWVDGRVKSEYA